MTQQSLLRSYLPPQVLINDNEYITLGLILILLTLIALAGQSHHLHSAFSRSRKSAYAKDSSTTEGDTILF
jgi:hypothetical protein